MKEAAERSSVAAAHSELPTTNHDAMAYGIYIYCNITTLHHLLMKHCLYVELSNDQEDDASASETYANQEDFNGDTSQDDDIDDREDPDDVNDIGMCFYIGTLKVEVLI
jgi:hypothetical protein